jgi:hypothetical protein
MSHIKKQVLEDIAQNREPAEDCGESRAGSMDFRLRVLGHSICHIFAERVDHRLWKKEITILESQQIAVPKKQVTAVSQLLSSLTDRHSTAAPTAKPGPPAAATKTAKPKWNGLSQRTKKEQPQLCT